MKIKYLILGAGPAGISFANRLLQNGENDFLVLERNDEAGGLCRSKVVDKRPLDIGGGHFLDVRNQMVLDFLFPFLPEENWNKYERNSKIDIKGCLINSPIEANIWQMPMAEQIEYLKSIAVAGCNLGQEKPEKFIDWIFWKLGKRIAEDYMIPYNQKMFGDDLDHLGTYWLDKLPNVSFEETLISCLERKAYGVQPGHATFFYPKRYGYGEIWVRMARKLGNRIHYNEKVTSLDYEQKKVNEKYDAAHIIVTIPWVSIERHLGIPDKMMQIINSLKYSSIVVDYKPERLETEAQWIYCPNLSINHHRILVRHNFCPDSNGYWTETNLNRFDSNKCNREKYFINDYAYPLNTIGKQEAMKSLLLWARKKRIYGLGRWGEWQHYNSDVVVDLAIKLADKMCM